MIPIMSESDNEIFHYPITDTLDLHQFNPRDIPGLIDEYIDECRRHGLHSLRIIHGKGTGRQKAIVLDKLKTNPGVISFRDAGDNSGWGATLVELLPYNPIGSQT